MYIEKGRPEVNGRPLVGTARTSFLPRALRGLIHPHSIGT